MGTVIMHSVVSVDGFIADANGGVGPLHEWYFSGDVPIVVGGDEEYDHSGAMTASRSRVRRRTTSGRRGSRSARL